MTVDVRRYWSHRKGHRESLTGEFWSGFDALLRRLIDETHRERYKTGIFGSLVKEQLTISGKNMGWTDYALRESIRERLGRSYYSPFNSSRQVPQSEEHVLDFLEVFHDLSVPGRQQEFTRELNVLLKRFNQPFELVNGEVHYRGSEVLDEPIEKLDGLSVPDSELRKYLQNAREAFFDARDDRRLEGLRSLYDGFERLKTLRGGTKLDSVSKIVEELAQSQDLRSHFDALFRNLTKISNDSNIRHSEVGKVVIDNDPVLIEYLFYSLWAIIRAALSREASDRGAPPK